MRWVALGLLSVIAAPMLVACTIWVGRQAKARRSDLKRAPHRT
jgi:hypothetical protein